MVFLHSKKTSTCGCTNHGVFEAWVNDIVTLTAGDVSTGGVLRSAEPMERRTGRSADRTRPDAQVYRRELALAYPYPHLDFGEAGPFCTVKSPSQIGRTSRRATVGPHVGHCTSHRIICLLQVYQGGPIAKGGHIFVGYIFFWGGILFFF